MVEIEALNNIYYELASVVGLDVAVKIYSEFRGQTITFPKKLYKNEYIYEQIFLLHRKGKKVNELAKEFDFSERWVRNILQSK